MSVPATVPKRGRASTEDLREKLARLEREAAAVRASLREADERKFSILGKAIAAEAENNPSLKAQLSEIIARRVTSAQAKADLATLISA